MNGPSVPRVQQPEGSLSAAGGPATVRLHVELDTLDQLGPRLDALFASTQAPVTARRAWLSAWFRAHREWRPLVVTVDRGPEVRAAAVLAWRRGRILDDVRAAGAGASDEVRLPARDAEAAELLAQGVAGALQDLHRPWRLVLRDLPPQEEAAQALLRRLRHAGTAPGDVSPRLALGPARDLRAHVSRNHHQQSRRLRNRLARDGHCFEVAQLTAPAEVAAVLPEVVSVCRARDHQLRRHSRLDGGPDLHFFLDVVTTHAARDEVALTALRVDGELAAYVLCFRDGSTWRMWNCRFHPAWAPYGVGRLSHDASLSAALDAGCLTYDWMRGDETYKDGLSDHSHRAQDLFAASHLALWTVDDGTRRLYRSLRSAKNASPGMRRAWDRVRPHVEAVRGARSSAGPRHLP